MGLTASNPAINELNASNPAMDENPQQREQQVRYISSICRIGPIPQTRHQARQILCLTIYFLLVLLTIVFFLINYFQSEITVIKLSELSSFNKVIFALNETLTETILASFCLIVAGILFLFILFIYYQILGYLIIVGCFSIFAFILYSLVFSQWTYGFGVSQKNKTNYEAQMTFMRILMFFITSVGVGFFIYVIRNRIDKVKNLSAMMGVVKIIIGDCLPQLGIINLFILNGLSILNWYIFSKALVCCIKLRTGAIPIFILICMLIINWIWNHGLLLSISDYLCQSWVLHWYFNKKNQHSQQELALKQNWNKFVIYKLFRYHIGTCIVASFYAAYFSEFIAKILTKTQIFNQNNTINQFTRYCFVETVMENLGYLQSNYQMYLLKKRIKQKIPEIYMLGHFLQQILKIMLAISGVYLWFLFISKMTNFAEQNQLDMSPFLFILLVLLIGAGLFLQISTHISHLFGMLSDIAIIAYSIDSEIERVHFNNNHAFSVPDNLKTILTQLHITMKIQQYEQPQPTDYIPLKGNQQFQ